MSTKRIVILGAGYGGLEAAKSLHKELRKKNDVEITLIDENNHHTLLTELHEVAGHRIEPNGVIVSVEHVLQYTNVKFVQDRIEGGDLKANKLFSSKGEYNFDYLILGVGSEPTYFGISGMKEHGFSLWSLEDAERIHHQIITMFEKAIIEKDPRKRRELLTFVVGGGGFTGLEMMGELMEWIPALCKRYEISRKDVRLVVVEAMDAICPILHRKLAHKIAKYMEKRGVEILTNSSIAQVTPDTVIIETGQIIKSNTLIWTGGVQAKSFVKNLGITLGIRNRIVVNQYLETKEYPYVYAIGDVMEFTEEKGNALPPLVETALQSGKCAALNIAAKILGKEKRTLKANLHGVMVSIGSTYGVAQLKGMPMLSGIFAIIMKHLVNMHYLFGIGGFELLWDYIEHQFVHKKRSYNWALETAFGHATRKNFTFWLVPLRIWLGIMWLISGINKIRDGWLSQSILQDIPLPDASSSATPIVDSGSEVVSKAFGLIGKNTPGWYEWIIRNIIYPNNILFQTLIVITELLLGLAFIFGALVFISALVSIVMNINFVLTTGLPLTESGLPNLWFIAASIAMMAGAGQCLGIDYYLIPYLQNQWRYFQRNRGFHLLKGWKW